MAAEMVEGEWDLDGYRFGGARPLRVARGSDIGSFSIDGGDIEVAGAAGLLAGRDWARSATWTLELFTNHRGRRGPQLEAQALDEWRSLAKAWRAGASLPPGVMSCLRTHVGGRVVAVYGRPRTISNPTPSVLTLQGRAGGAAQFVVMDPVVYHDAQESLTLTLGQDPTGGASWPAVWPLTWDRASVARQGVVHVAGDALVPFRVEVFGPSAGTASGFSLSGPGWAVDVDVALAAADSLVIDTRAGTVTRNGVSVVGGLSRRSRLTARLAPGDSEIVFAAADPSNTSRAVLTWHPGHYSL